MPRIWSAVGAVRALEMRVSCQSDLPSLLPLCSLLPLWSFSGPVRDRRLPDGGG
jgi:hypothetical protein